MLLTQQLFITGFRQFDYGVPWFSFLHVSLVWSSASKGELIGFIKSGHLGPLFS